MPTNLDALIRYKTLDNCLASGRRYTLYELAEKCSEALSDKSGISRSVSVRTIQDDIRVMRSDQLAFNAPVEVRNGLYFYSLPGEYVFKKRIDNRDELVRILKALIKIHKEIQNPELFNLICDLEDLTGEGIVEKPQILFRKSYDKEYRDTKKDLLVPKEPTCIFYWDEVMRVLNIAPDGTFSPL